MSEQLSFQPKARLLLQLGDQLIRNESIALLELIKNSYDAYASKVTITMYKVDDPSNGYIIIEDDGIGMTAEIIKEVWMQPGSDYKDKIVRKVKKRGYKRIPIGEKGIGRFGVHKLGNKIELISKTDKGKEVSVNINWKKFEEDTTLGNIKVLLEERSKPACFSEKTRGTYIKITDLRKSWTRNSVRELYRAATSLSSPFSNLDSFSVLFKLDNQDWLDGLIRFEDIKEYALYRINGVIDKDVIARLYYQFTPLPAMKRISGRKEILSDVKMVKMAKHELSRKKVQVPVNIDKYKIGPIAIEMLIFDREPKILNYGITDKEGFKTYLDANGGMRVYRDGIRIFNYGEKDNDWLKLDIKRVNKPGENISNNLIIGAVKLDRLKSLDLTEKTNREGFIEDDVYETFQDAVSFFIEKVLSLRNVDKNKLRRLFGSSSVAEPVIGRLKVLKDTINDVVPKGKDKDEIIKTIKGIESDYKSIIDIYTRSSSAGLSLGIVIHEVEKIIDELVKAVDKIHTDKYLKNLVETLDKTVNNYASVVRKSSKTKEDVLLLLDRGINNVQFRIRAHGVLVLKEYKKRINTNTTVFCTANLFISSIMNLVDNSIWWMNYANRKSKKILIDILDNYEKGFLCVLIADNGPGFSIPTEDAIKPFISDKPEGMGLGLHLVEVMMLGLKGKVIFPGEYEVSMPAEFQKGAKIILAFKK